MIQMQNSTVTQQEHKISITMHQTHPPQQQQQYALQHSSIFI